MVLLVASGFVDFTGRIPRGTRESALPRGRRWPTSQVSLSKACVTASKVVRVASGRLS
jgi:hypothetical protein